MRKGQTYQTSTDDTFTVVRATAKHVWFTSAKYGDMDSPRWLFLEYVR